MKIRLISLILLLFLCTYSSFAQWEWLNPYPQGRDLWEIQFIEDTNIGYVMASGGGVLKTLDGGSNWEILSIDAMPTLSGAYGYSGICFITSELGYFGGRTFVKTADGGQTSELIENNIRINAMGFIGENLGFAAINGGSWQPTSELYRITDGGHTWEEMNQNPLDRVESIIITEDSTIILGGHKGMLVFPNYNYYYSIAYSEDLGESWTDTIFAGRSGWLRDMVFKNKDIGYACGSAGFLVQTIDGGRTWEQLNFNPEKHPASLSLHGDSIIALASYGPSFISENEGLSWDTLGLPINFKLQDVDVNRWGDCFAVGSNGSMFKLESGSREWIKTSKNAADRGNQALFNIHFPSADVGYTSGHFGNIFKTIDGGNNWEKLERFNSRHLWDLYCIDENLVYAVNGNIIRSVDGGESWEKAFDPPNSPLANISFVSSGFGFASGNMNKVYKTDNNGWSWRNISPDHGNYGIYDHVFFDSLNGIVVGSNHYYAETHNGGVSWLKRSVAPQAEGNLNSICFPSREVGYMVGTANYFYKTIDGGQTWNISDIGHGPHGFVYFIDEDNGFIVDHIVRQTLDGGLTWDTVKQSASIAFGDMYMAPDSTLFYCGAEAMIMRNRKFKDNSTGINDIVSISDIQVNVWPNPSSDYCNIHLSGLSDELVEVFMIDISGFQQLLYSGKGDQGEKMLNIEVGSLPPGIYLLLVNNGNTRKTIKIILH